MEKKLLQIRVSAPSNHEQGQVSNKDLHRLKVSTATLHVILLSLWYHFFFYPLLWSSEGVS